MRYHRNKSLFLFILVLFINIHLCAQDKKQIIGNIYDVSIISKGPGNILCNEQFIVGNDERKEFTLRNNAVVRLKLSPNKGGKLLKFTINGINRLPDIKNNQITLKDISRKTVIVATFEEIAFHGSTSTNHNNKEDYTSLPSTGTYQKYLKLNLHQISIGFQQYTLKDFATKDIKSNYGVFASYGNTYLLNSTPSSFNWGLDIVFTEAGYNNYQLRYREKTDYYHQIELGVQAGLSLIMVASESLWGKIYIRYAPRYSMLNANKKWYNCYGNYIVGGASFHFFSFGIGGEFCYGSCKYLKEDNEDAPNNANFGLRIFVSFII